MLRMCEIQHSLYVELTNDTQNITTIPLLCIQLWLTQIIKNDIIYHVKRDMLNQK